MGCNNLSGIIQSCPHSAAGGSL